ncbi:DUF4158 domain-containing protein [Yersinia pekkanenii]|uniref:DUF4158 domain-containing protein n=1 Tax=Yersinia pekkanenii TaxID=1288385 RepID=UPI00092CF2D3
MTDKGRLGFAIQLKFIELYGRFPEDNRQINTDVAQALAKQLSVPIDAIASYDPCSRQGQRHRRTIRDFLGYRPSTGADLKQLKMKRTGRVVPRSVMPHNVHNFVSVLRSKNR